MIWVQVSSLGFEGGVEGAAWTWELGQNDMAAGLDGSRGGERRGEFEMAWCWWVRGWRVEATRLGYIRKHSADGTR